MKHLINSFVAAVFTFGIGTTSVSAGNELDSNNNANASNVPMGSEGSTNTSYGRGALSKNTRGNWNTAIGSAALQKNTGSRNTASGYQALYKNTTGWYNTASGSYALYHNYGNFNTASGDSALYQNTRGYQNTASGSYALTGNTKGSYNIASVSLPSTSTPRVITTPRWALVPVTRIKLAQAMSLSDIRPVIRRKVIPNSTLTTVTPKNHWSMGIFSRTL